MVYNYLLAAVGLLLLAGGLIDLKAFEDLLGLPRAVPYICVGIGCGLFGHGIGGVLSRLALRNSPDAEKQLKTEQKDERNITIRERAKGRAFDLMVYLFSALMFPLRYGRRFFCGFAAGFRLPACNHKLCLLSD